MQSNQLGERGVQIKVHEITRCAKNLVAAKAKRYGVKCID